MPIIAILIAYLLGSINTAIITCKLAHLSDPRTQGSGNPGASNVLRVAGKKYAAITVLGDALKGFVAVFVGKILGCHGLVLSLVALSAVLGHMYPVYFKFDGGKGVATALGAYFALSFSLGAIALIVWIALAFFFRYSSLASLAACIVAPVACLLLIPSYFLGLLLITLLIIWRHRENVDRLRNGTEAKINFKKSIP